MADAEDFQLCILYGGKQKMVRAFGQGAAVAEPLQGLRAGSEAGVAAGCDTYG